MKILRTTEQLVFDLAQETICNVINVFLEPPNSPTSANQTSAVCGQGKVRVQRVFKEKDNFVLVGHLLCLWMTGCPERKSPKTCLI